MVEYKKNLSEPWFSLIKLGIKKYEGRLNKGDFAKMNKGDILIFENNDFGFLRSFRCRIKNTKKFDTFQQFLQTKTLKKCLPGIDTIDNGVKVYYKYYTKHDEEKYKIISIRMKVV
jgi:ASC-1-like (ASCH) protein